MFKIRYVCCFSLRLSSSFVARVRFAPSPTGLMHVGGLKTAFINHIFAASHQGKLIFRLEDTDRIRYNHRSVENIIKSLTWLGIKFDEGIEAGSPQKDYIQSNRLIHYDKAVERLISDGKAYYCFCSSERLEFLKKEQNRRGENPCYDRKCFKLTSKEITNKIQHGSKYVVRLKVEDNNKIDFTDDVFGHISVHMSSFDGDSILRKADGYPVYHLANVVDDHMMGITHVIRGQEWLVSTPKHILLYRAFGWKPPNFAHLPLIMKSDGHKISKRDPDFLKSFHNVNNLIENGFSPETIISWLMSTGGGLTCEWHPSISLSEIFEKFSLSRMSTHGAILDDSTLRLIGRSYFNSLVLTPLYFDDIIAPFLTKHNVELSFKRFEFYFHQLKHRVTCLKDFIQFSYLWTFTLISMDKLYAVMEGNTVNLTVEEAVQQLLRRLLTIINSKNSEMINLNMLHEGICTKSSAMKCLRKLLINKDDGPRISELIHLLSREEINRRINSILLNIHL